MRATWLRLDGGSWGVRVEVQFSPILDALVGQTVEVVRVDGRRTLETIDRVLAKAAPQPATRKRPARPAFAVCTVVPRGKPAKVSENVRRYEAYVAKRRVTPRAPLADDTLALLANVPVYEVPCAAEAAAAERCLEPR